MLVDIASIWINYFSSLLHQLDQLSSGHGFAGKRKKGQAFIKLHIQGIHIYNRERQTTRYKNDYKE